jgi:hypothetical protein
MIFALLLAISVSATATGFENPESACWDAASRSWYVSNVAGEETAKDGNGWISRLDANGKVAKSDWVTGLNAPHGIRTKGTKLYVADINELVVIDIPSARVKARVDAPGAAFLNDVAIGKAGEVYVSDTIRSAIYHCTESRCEVFLENAKLEGPNGLLVEGNRLIVASWGVITNSATFETKKPGRLIAVDLTSKEILPIGSGKPIGNLDGIERDGAGYLVTDFMAGKLFRVSSSGTATLLKGGFKNSADFGYDPSRNLIALPEMSGGTVQMLKLK